MTRSGMLVLAAMGLAAVGCAKTYKLESDFGSSPGYSSTERYQNISRAWDYDGKQFMDDVDSAFLLQPPSMLTRWDVR